MTNQSHVDIAAIIAGTTTAVSATECALAAIDAADDEVRAWTVVDAAGAKAQAQARDEARARGEPVGLLHGIGVGVKDVVDVAGLPCRNGTVLDDGRIPQQDAYLVTRLRQAGAVVLGKTVSTELAFLAPSVTRNPVNLAHTPGGSSAGSAAAVAAGMVPAAIGTQTGGSILRPASYCGVVGFKPSFGAIARTGTLEQSPTLDTLGTFTRTVTDAARLAAALFGDDGLDFASAGTRPHPPDMDSFGPSNEPLRFGFITQPPWPEADPELRAAFEAFIAGLDFPCPTLTLPAAFDTALASRDTINNAEMAYHLAAYRNRDQGQLSHEIKAAMASGDSSTGPAFVAAQAHRRVLRSWLGAIFSHIDILITPAAPGPAPRGFSSTGRSVFNGIWTLCGTPAISLPLLTSASGLPIGVQLIGPVGTDVSLLRAAAWLAQHLGTDLG
jgi:aspartyl-tRNA(Asn)/glutamyl-tRNA(Gln) amidotransferase subunit A